MGANQYCSEVVKSVWTIKKSHSIGCGLSNDSLTNVTVTVNKLKGSRFESHSESKAVFWLIDLSTVCVRSRGTDGLNPKIPASAID